jgi:pimeloyl-ACP methyl ester carboxylesterase
VDLLRGFQEGVRQYLVLRGVSSSFVELNGRRVHYYHLQGRGSGPPVLLVHGLGGNSNGFSRTFFGLAARFGRVWAMDLPGNGFSPLPDAGALPLPEQLKVLADFCEKVVREPAFVVGNSLGGALSVMLAALFPQWVRALVLVSPAGAKVADERLAETLAALQVNDNAQARQLLRRLFHRAPLAVLLMAPELKKLYGTPAVRSIFAEVAQGGSLDPETLKAIKVPILLIWGRSEKLLPYESVEFFRAHLPSHAQIDVVEGFGHVPQVERPKELVRRLTQFADTAGL